MSSWLLTFVGGFGLVLSANICAESRRSILTTGVSVSFGSNSMVMASSESVSESASIIALWRAVCARGLRYGTTFSSDGDVVRSLVGSFTFSWLDARIPRMTCGQLTSPFPETVPVLRVPGIPSPLSCSGLPNLPAVTDHFRAVECSPSVFPICVVVCDSSAAFPTSTAVCGCSHTLLAPFESLL